MIRLFVGSFLADAQALGQELREFAGEIAVTKQVSFKAVPTANLHITYQFLGEVDNNQLATIKDRLSKIACQIKAELPIAVTYDTLSAWPSPEKARVFVAEPSIKPQALMAVGNLIRQNLQELVAIDLSLERNLVFKPHITLFRMKNLDSEPIYEMALQRFKPISQTIEFVDLIESKGRYSSIMTL